ncbi:L-rhamnose mutarotase [Dyadobacter luticola]|uniref:L-rhamnose mutarotase n=1 Tax=Dyadobacter luticola TaxID=1979387 RepID=A0A5R9KZG4_9BACT|nr:L-rhamnose mutarotase [Dyadobacter luticola]TLV01480.1 L-rhamnose mutarotase [Dyadobacter luticola]
MGTKRTCMALDLVDEPNLISEYAHYHSLEGMWPEIPAGIREAGVLDMQIYRIGSRLFMIVDFDENTDLTEAFQKMGQMPRQTEWATLMAEFQKTLPEARAGEHWAAMEPVFLLNDHMQ